MADPIDTKSDYGLPSSLLSMFLGEDFRGAMKSIISLGVGDAMRHTAGETPFGPGALFEQQNLGKNLVEHFVQQTVSSSLQGSAEMRERARYDLNQRFAGMLGIAPGESNPLGMTAVSFLGTELFRTLGTQQLETGLGQVSRYMGLLPAGLVRGADEGRQRALQRELSTFNAAVMQDFTSNFDQYGGLGGAGVGRILAEGARLGMLTPNNPQAAIEFAKSTAQAIGTAQQFFQGSATETWDQMNALVGVNAIGTLGAGGQLNRTLTQMGAAGMVTGLTDQHMNMLATNASNLSRQISGNPLGAFANARDTALLITAANRSGITAFVNEASLRQSITNQVVQTQESEASRAVYGAYAMLQEQDPGKAEAFMTRINKVGGDLTLSTVTGLAAELGLNNVSAGDLVHAGYSQPAELARAQGGATVTMVTARLQSIQDDRGDYLRSRGLDVGSLGGDLSIQNINKVFGARTSGEISQIFDLQAKRYGYRTGTELDAALRSTEIASALQGAMEGTTGMLADLQGFGRVRGALGFASLVNKLGTDAPGLSAARLVESLIGGDADAVRKVIGGGGGIFSPDVIKEIQADGNILGLDVAVQALQTHQIGNRQLDETEMAEVREMFTTSDVQRRNTLLGKFGSMTSPERRLAFNADQATTEMLKEHGKYYSAGALAGMSEEKRGKALAEMGAARKEFADEGKLIAQLQAYEQLTSKDTDVVGAGDERGKYGAYAQRYRGLVHQGRDSAEARKELKKEMGDDFEGFIQNFEANSNIQASMGASAESSVMGRIMMLLQQLFNAITKDGIKTNPEPAANPAKKEGE